ncbi:MAG: tryptophan halogenase family protein [Xanthomonadales bacterium]|nr:tryptophan halogenase family protein [Xanthomonadales bacterium]
MTPQEPTRVVIVGGGTAGWLAAAALARLLGPAARIELVESDAIGTVGVGEATIPQLRLLLQVLGINEDDFMRHTGATVKLGIQFEGWGDPGGAYMHAFGSTGRGLALLPFHHYWLRAQAQGLRSDLWDFSFNLRAARANRFERVGADPQTGLDALVYAYHFDASRVAVYLRRFAERLGVKRTEGRVVDVERDPEREEIRAVRLEDERRVAGDLFIDCSGFRGLLIEETLQAGFEDWSRWLPCNRAVAVQCEGVSPLVPYTRARARQAGWQWRIPLQSRTGNGHVFCSDFLGEDEATETLLGSLDGAVRGDPRVIRFTTGMRKQFWKGNCVALGLASGFMEPLESTSIHLVQSGVDRLVKLFPRPRPEPSAVAEYNRQTRREFELIRDFLVLHYHLNQRPGEFWRACRDMDLPDGLAHKMSLFQSTGGIVRDAGDLFAEEAWLQVMIGQGMKPDAWHPMADRLTHEQLAQFMSQSKKLVKQAVNRITSHESFIAQHCAE